MELPQGNALVRVLAQSPFDGREVASIEYKGQPVWLAGQVALALGYTDGDRVGKSIRDEWSDEVTEGDDFVILNGEDLKPLKAAGLVGARAPSVMLLTESGVYLVTILSRQPKAKAFRRWLASDLLPSLRRQAEAPPPAESSRRKGPRRKALAGPQPLWHYKYVTVEEVAVQRLVTENWANPILGIREYLIAFGIDVIHSQRIPETWRRFLVEDVARQSGLTVNEFEGDDLLEEAKREWWLVRAQLQELLERLGDAQLVRAVVTVARRTGAMRVLNAAELKDDRLRWLPAPDPAESLRAIRDDLARVSATAERLGG